VKITNVEMAKWIQEKPVSPVVMTQVVVKALSVVQMDLVHRTVK